MFLPNFRCAAATDHKIGRKPSAAGTWRNPSRSSRVNLFAHGTRTRAVCGADAGVGAGGAARWRSGRPMLTSASPGRGGGDGDGAGGFGRSGTGSRRLERCDGSEEFLVGIDERTAAFERDRVCTWRLQRPCDRLRHIFHIGRLQSRPATAEQFF